MQIAFMSVLGAGFYQSAQAQSIREYYVCSGTSFTLQSASTADNYEWRVIGASSPFGTGQTTSSITAPTLVAGDNADTLKYEFRVETGGCWSDPDTFYVHVLPPLDVAISGGAGTYCTNNPQTLTLTASLATTPGALPNGVAADQYQWEIDGTPAGTSATQNYTTGATSSSVKVTMGYSIPSTSAGDKLGGCDAASTTSVSITVTAAPTTPAVTLQ